MKFNENPSGGSRVFQCGRSDTQRDGRTKKKTEMTKLIIAFCNFVYPPENESQYPKLKNK
jgi:hypothetical protein